MKKKITPKSTRDAWRGYINGILVSVSPDKKEVEDVLDSLQNQFGSDEDKFTLDFGPHEARWKVVKECVS